jgi:hypothetical protein
VADETGQEPPAASAAGAAGCLTPRTLQREVARGSSGRARRRPRCRAARSETAATATGGSAGAAHLRVQHNSRLLRRIIEWSSRR